MAERTHDDASLRRLITEHGRHWRDFDYIYPVISRRSRGLSIGINLNIDTACNFDCVYCQVDRTTPPARRDVDLTQIRTELETLVDDAASGEIWHDPQFADVPPEMRRVNDIAFSGDGEPTACPQFVEACALAAELRAKHALSGTKLVLITNATLLHRERVQEGLAVLDANGGEIWAKLDAGTEDYFQRIDRPRGRITLAGICANIAAAGRVRPLVIQSLFMQVHGQPVPAAEFEAYLDRLAALRESGCRIKHVQLYTIARQTAEPYVQPLTDAQMDAVGQRFRERLPDLPVLVFYGVGE